jgi:hypothetical protein
MLSIKNQCTLFMRLASFTPYGNSRLHISVNLMGNLPPELTCSPHRYRRRPSSACAAGQGLTRGAARPLSSPRRAGWSFAYLRHGKSAVYSLHPHRDSLVCGPVAIWFRPLARSRDQQDRHSGPVAPTAGALGSLACQLGSGPASPGPAQSSCGSVAAAAGSARSPRPLWGLANGDAPIDGLRGAANFSSKRAIYTIWTSPRKYHHMEGRVFIRITQIPLIDLRRSLCLPNKYPTNCCISK